MSSRDVYTVYGWSTCPWTIKALEALKQARKQYVFKDVRGIQGEAMRSFVPAGRPLTVPQIYHNGRYVGGCTDLLNTL